MLNNSKVFVKAKFKLGFRLMGDAF